MRKKWLRSWVLLTVCLMWTIAGWWAPVQAATFTDPDLEEAVVQIILKHPDAILESVRRYEQQQAEQQKQAQKVALNQFKSNPKAEIGGSPIQGSINRNIVLMEFSDFQCPYCAGAVVGVQQFMAKHQDQVTLVYKHYPLTQIHKEALGAARAAWAAGQQGKFWPYHDALFTHQDQLGEAFYLDTAKSLELNLPRFNADRASNQSLRAIEADAKLAEKLGIEGTPFFVLNGIPFAGAVSVADLEGYLAQTSAQR